jgi:hypothetical protein
MMKELKHFLVDALANDVSEINRQSRITERKNGIWLKGVHWANECRENFLAL